MPLYPLAREEMTNNKQEGCYAREQSWRSCEQLVCLEKMGLSLYERLASSV